MSVELAYLRHFFEVARQGSFTRAAAILRAQQPSMSRSVRLLEESLDLRLIEREGRRARGRSGTADPPRGAAGGARPPAASLADDLHRPGLDGHGPDRQWRDRAGPLLLPAARARLPGRGQARRRGVPAGDQGGPE